MKRTVLAIALLGAVHFSGQANQGTGPKKQPTDPNPTVFHLEYNQSGNQSKNGAQENAPRWYASPEWWLVIVAIPTLFFIWYEAKKTAESAEATKASAEAARDSVILARSQAEASAKDVRRLNRAYLTVDRWKAKNIPASPDAPWRVIIRFSVYNPSRTAARIERLDYKIGSRPEEHSLPYGVKIMLTPRERYEVRVPAVPITETDNVVTIRGKITYLDIFRQERHRTFSRSVLCGKSDATFFRAEMAGMNDEEEWDNDD